MKFYKEKLRNYTYRMLCINKLTAIINSKNKVNYVDCVYFLKNGKFHNSKNATYTDNNRCKSFYLNNKFYGNQKDFTKKSWRKFVKLQIFS
jgi:hypothetical protein